MIGSTILYKIYEKRLWRQIKNGPRPQHIGLIMDGNRRFAQDKGMDPSQGHTLGSQKLDEFLIWCWRLDVRIVTLFGFSTENYNRRSDAEKQHLMGLILKKIKDLQINPVVKQKQVKVRVIGRREYLSDELNQEITKLEEMTKDHDHYQLNMAIGYGGRTEIIDAIKKVAKKIVEHELSVDDINERQFSQYLYTDGIPDPDLIIRTSGEERLSGFLLWQSAYSELYFSEVYFPAFRVIDFWRAIRVFQQRERRFGQ
jgi:tritrans,polycis-undecaprenyl-diphosphate synthase [geranylgeranyl-diphosphate specific]